VVSAVDLLKGIGKLAGLETPHVPGATGYIDTDYDAKVGAALESLRRSDFVYLHVEAPDEASHVGNLEHKLKAIADFDARIVGPMRRGLEALGEEFGILLLPDHPTPLATRTHTRDAVPFVLFLSSERGRGKGGRAFTEFEALSTGVFVPEAHRLLGHILGKSRLW
jgi:2,3-bisphosphoglycerate-independent phosphoglycerate mutase